MNIEGVSPTNSGRQRIKNEEQENHEKQENHENVCLSGMLKDSAWQPTVIG
jgi:hypothetical protein